MKRLFHICTIVNRLEHYQAMRNSFDAAGFSERACRFSMFDNTAGNTHDPYRLLDGLIADTPERYLILCHQDVRADLGHTLDHLVSALEDLSEADPKWAVAGNAGVDARGNAVLHLDDPHGTFRSSRLPRRVTSLDENFLVIRPGSGLATSPGLDGFHFYGTDLALNARLRGQGAYVIDFLLTHLSPGDAASHAFAQSRERFARAWRERLLVGLIRTTAGPDFCVSRAPAIEKLLRRHRIGCCLRRLGMSFIPAFGAH